MTYYIWWWRSRCGIPFKIFNLDLILFQLLKRNLFVSYKPISIVVVWLHMCMFWEYLLKFYRNSINAFNFIFLYIYVYVYNFPMNSLKSYRIENDQCTFSCWWYVKGVYDVGLDIRILNVPYTYIHIIRNMRNLSTTLWWLNVKYLNKELYVTLVHHLADLFLPRHVFMYTS